MLKGSLRVQSYVIEGVLSIFELYFGLQTAQMELDYFIDPICGVFFG